MSLKRSEERSYPIRALETLNIFGLNADYVTTFLEAIRREEVDFEQLILPIKLVDPNKWETLPLIETPEDFDFSKRHLRLEIKRDIMDKVRVDIRPKITVTHGLVTAEGETFEETVPLGERILDLLNWDELYYEILNHKLSQEYFNLQIDRVVLPELAKGNDYHLYALPEQIRVEHFPDLAKIRQIVLVILKNYVSRFYNFKLQQAESNELKLAHLTKDHENLSFGSYTLKVSKSEETEVQKIERLLSEAEKLYERDFAEIPSVHFDRHLYTPLVVYGKGKDFVKSDPPKLNEGETQFVRKLREYLGLNREWLENRELFLLRNLSQRGVRFFQTRGFYPDFIMWIRSENHMTLSFLDPKGIRNSGNFNDEKIQLHKNLKELEQRFSGQNLRLESFILSVSRYFDIKKTFEDGKRPKQDFEDNHVLFIEDTDLVPKLLERLS